MKKFSRSVLAFAKNYSGARSYLEALLANGTETASVVELISYFRRS